MRTPANAQTTAAWRFEKNLITYLSGVLKSLGVKHQALTTNDFEPREAPVIMDIDAHSDLTQPDDGLLWVSNSRLYISGQIDGTKSRAHKDIVSHVYDALFLLPPPKNRSPRLTAHPSALLALNFNPGQPDRRPVSSLHVFDMMSPSVSLAGADSMADTWITFVASFVGQDWDGGAIYGQ